jgi:hypothetical protein
MYTEKRVQSGTGEFGRILLIHAIFHQTWGVARYYQRPLNNFRPSAVGDSHSSTSNIDEIWLPDHDVFSKWRNGACDCLDLLHWAANSTIALRGVEHATVCHLHVARLVLLTPCTHIRTLALSLVGGNAPLVGQGNIIARQQIWRWVNNDQHKARLSMIHAGALIWHLRRYKTDAFYEPAAVLLATLAIWAYGSFCSTHESQRSSPVSTPGTSGPTFIRLDRPCDDELVQIYVRDDGARMRAHISGVGNILAPQGPERVLMEGRRLLETLGTWACAQRMASMLERLAHLTREQSRVQSPYEGETESGET